MEDEKLIIEANEAVSAGKKVWPSEVDTSGKDEPEKAEKKFIPDKYDLFFALFMFPVGFFFARWVLFSWSGWGTLAFTVLYLAGGSAYFFKRGIKQSGEGLFWMAVVFLTALSCALWSGYEIITPRSLLLLFSAGYWVLASSGRTIRNGSSNYILLDAVSAFISLPFTNFSNQYRSFSVLKRERERKRNVWPVVLGVSLAVLVLTIVIPLLESADSGGFSKIVGHIQDFFDFLAMDFLSLARNGLYFIIMIPVAGYLFGLFSGASNKRTGALFDVGGLEEGVASIRVLPVVTVYIVLSTVCAVYAVFIASQFPYFFSAFRGTRPEGWLVYSEYARRGFFELCAISVLNLVFLLAANILSKKKRTECAPLRIFNIALIAITMIFIATAFSKMALYIDVYGLSMRRVLPCIFMVFLLIVCVLVLVLQKKAFSIVRASIFAAAVMACAFCLVNPDAQIVRYNTERYLAGTLETYDEEILYRSGFAGVVSAYEVYNSDVPQSTKQVVFKFLVRQKSVLSYLESHSYTLETARARGILDEFPNENVDQPINDLQREQVQITTSP